MEICAIGRILDVHIASFNTDGILEEALNCDRLILTKIKEELGMILCARIIRVSTNPTVSIDRS